MGVLINGESAARVVSFYGWPFLETNLLSSSGFDF